VKRVEVTCYPMSTDFSCVSFYTFDEEHGVWHFP
jgi:hypothetical protein